MKVVWRLAPTALLLAWPGWAGQVTVTLLATTDLHGNLYPVDYYTGQAAPRGLAAAASLIDAVRKETPNTLLIDCGDVIEGSPLESVYQGYVNSGRLPLGLRFAGPPLRHDPMMVAMNQLGYAAMVLGNHEFNFGLKSLDRARRDARFPWLSANTEVEPGSRARPFQPYLLTTVAGVRVAVIGITTPAIPTWDEPAHWKGYRFLDGRQALETTLASLRQSARPNLVIAAVHAGLGSERHRDLAENMVLDIARNVKGIDAIVFGHSHQELEGDANQGVLLIQPKNWGMSVARVDFTLDDAGGRWHVVRKTPHLLRVRKDTPADPAVMAAARPYHELTERYLNTPVAVAPADMDGAIARFIDTPLVDVIQAVQLAYTHADVSFTALFHPALHVSKGPVTVRQMAALYTYDNELYTIEGTGRMVKEALENSARYFLTCPDAACSHGPLVGKSAVGFNYDMAEGIDYEIDLRRPEGDRIVNLRWKGKALDPEQKLRIALNNYRAGGSGGYTMFRGAPVVWKSSRDIRSLMIEYYTQAGRLPERASGNWRIIPAEAVRVLESTAVEH